MTHRIRMMTEVHAAAAVVLAVVIAAGEARASPRCDRAVMPIAAYGECLRVELAASEASLVEATARLKTAIDSRRDLQPTQRVRLKRLTDETQDLWLRFRNADCQDVATLHAGPRARLFEERLLCVMRHNAARLAEFERRAAGP